MTETMAEKLLDLKKELTLLKWDMALLKFKLKVLELTLEHTIRQAIEMKP